MTYDNLSVIRHHSRKTVPEEYMNVAAPAARVFPMSFDMTVSTHTCVRSKDVNRTCLLSVAPRTVVRISEGGSFHPDDQYIRSHDIRLWSR